MNWRGSLFSPGIFCAANSFVFAILNVFTMKLTLTVLPAADDESTRISASPSALGNRTSTIPCDSSLRPVWRFL